MKQHPQVQKRRIVRERVMQALYAFEVSGDPVEHVVATLFTGHLENGAELEFARALFLTTVQHRHEIDAMIRNTAVNWEFGRIALVDRLLLRMGICEMMYFDDIPPKVSINEAIDIAKRFSTEKSGQFINGILDRILQELKADGSIHKAGRGLLDTAPHPPRSNARSLRSSG